MIRKLRVKLVLMNMAFVAVLLAVMFAVVVQTTRNNLAESALQAMRQAALDPIGPGRPGQSPEEREMPCFVLRLGRRGELLVSGDGYYDLTDEEWLRALLEEAAAAGGEEGVLKAYNLRFCWAGPPDRPALVFAGMSGEAETLETLARTCLLAGSAAFLGFLAVSVLLSRWAVGPVERAWEQQRQFVADASHELKTPLAVILTNAELLREGPADEAARSRFTGSILSMAQRMRTLVESLLELARVEAGAETGSMETTSFSRLVREAVLPFEPMLYEAGLTLAEEIEDGISVRGVEGQLRQVVDILLDNARKYTAPGGEVRVSLRRSGRHCLLVVSGPGVPLTKRERRDVFKRFYRADAARSQGGGFGLGLAIAQGIVSRHGGRIWAESGKEGNCFFVRLPGGRQAAGLVVDAKRQ